MRVRGSDESDVYRNQILKYVFIYSPYTVHVHMNTYVHVHVKIAVSTQTSESDVFRCQILTSTDIRF